MKKWIKKEISKEDVFNLSKKYSIDSLTASVCARRGITKGEDLIFFLEDDLRFLHNPFLFNQMEDAVDRILDAKEEGEKVLIFGDRDVDGITSTTILYEYLNSIGIDVEYRVPMGDESYGLTIEVIDDFAKNYGTLIITVDNGISNINEIKYASELGIDIIVTDHHTPQEVLPEPAIIINPKTSDSGYPFAHISGCAVAFKLIQALRFSQTELYKQDICLLNAYENENGATLECVKLHNNLEKERFCLENINEGLKISDTKLETFLRGQQIFTWDDLSTKKVLKNIFGTSVEFNTFDLRPEVSKIIPSVQNLSLEQLKLKSKIAHYKDSQSTLINGFINIFITYINQKSNEAFPSKQIHEQNELQLVAIAALADVMPLENENRIFINNALKSMNSGKIRHGLIELLAKLDLLNKRISAMDLSWTLIPALNATGRLGQPKLSIEILLEQDSLKRNEIASKIIELNTERKTLVNSAQEFISYNAEMSFQKYQNFCFIIEKKINRGVIGLIAARLSQKYKVPAIAITVLENDIAIGSMRSLRGVDCPTFLSQFNEYFINYGGHSKAAGFSLPYEKLNSFQEEFEKKVPSIQLEEDDDDTIYIDAELPPNYITPELFKLIDLFEPYGEKNSPLTFMTQNLKIASYQIVGKTEKQHLKLTLDSGNHKIPVMFWNSADKINKEFSVGDYLNIVYTVERNIFNGMENIQIIIKDYNGVRK